MLKKKFITGLYILLIISLTIFLPFRLQHGVGVQTGAQPSTVMASQFNNDAFYYLALAKNYQTHKYTTYDGEYATNGYQFLWQNILDTILINQPDKSLQLKYTFWMCLLLTTISYVLLFLSLHKLTGSNILSVLTIIPGFFYLIFDKLIGENYSPWALINGMESSLSVLIFSVLLMLFTYRDIEKDFGKIYMLLFGFIFSILFLARLDEIFLLVSFLIVLFIAKRSKHRIKGIIYVSIIPLVTILAYLIYNYSSFGLVLPVSGLAKSAFYPNNLVHLLHTIYTGRSFDFLYGEHLYSRVLPLIVPMLIVILLSKKLLNNTYFSFNNKLVLLIKTLKYYVIFKSMYMLFFVDFWKQGFWYFFIPVIIMNIFIMMWIKTIVGEKVNSNGFQLVAIILILILTNGYYLDAENISKQKIISGKLDYYTINNKIDSAIGKVKILEMDDGIISFSVDNHCLSGTGLCLDREAFRYEQEGKLLEIAAKRGYQFIASVNYFKKPDLLPGKINSSADFFEISIDRKFYAESLKYSFEKVLADEKTGLVLLKFVKR